MEGDFYSGIVHLRNVIDIYIRVFLPGTKWKIIAIPTPLVTAGISLTSAGTKTTGVAVIYM